MREARRSHIEPRVYPWVSIRNEESKVRILFYSFLHHFLYISSLRGGIADEAI